MPNQKTNFDLLVIGAGSGGATVAIEAAELGISSAVFEHRDLGGTCVHRGCIPKKLFWHAADIVRHTDSARAYGIDIQKNSLHIDYPILQRHSRQHINGISNWFESEFKRVGVQVIKGSASFKDAHTLVADGVEYHGKRIVIATGSSPDRPNIPGADLAITSDEFFALEQLPRRIAIVGSGYIAIELACALNAAGVEVTMIVRRNNLSRHFDAEVIFELAQHLVDQGIKILWEHSSQSITRTSAGDLQIEFANQKQAVRSDCLLWAVGRSANIEKLAIDQVPLVLNEAGYIQTDTRQRTAHEHIFALGDVAGRHLLTPVAIRAGRYLVRQIYGGEDICFDYTNIPSVIYAHPPYASIGMTEQEASKEYGADLKIWRHRFGTLASALEPAGAREAMIKMMVHQPSDRVVGLHILAQTADEMMQGFAVAITMGATKADFDRCVAIHPTVAEEVVTLK